MYFDFSFFTIATAISKIFLLMAAGYALYHFRVIDARFNDMLSAVLVRLLFPALIISKTVGHFSFTAYGAWWILPLSAVFFALGGMLVGRWVHALVKNGVPKKEFMCSCGFQNCGYLPMNLILFAFAGEIGDRLLVYVFLYSMGFNLIMWSLVPFFLTGKIRSGFRLKALLNAPVVAVLISLTWVGIFGRGSIPHILADPLRILGEASFPVAMLTLGAYLCQHRVHDPGGKMPLVMCAAAKLVLFPAIVLLALMWLPLSYEHKFFLFLQGVMPTAVSLVVIGGYTNADNRFFASSIFYTHLAAVVTIPLWFGVFHALIK